MPSLTSQRFQGASPPWRLEGGVLPASQYSSRPHGPAQAVQARRPIAIDPPCSEVACHDRGACHVATPSQLASRADFQLPTPVCHGRRAPAACPNGSGTSEDQGLPPPPKGIPARFEKQPKASPQNSQRGYPRPAAVPPPRDPAWQTTRPFQTPFRSTGFRAPPCLMAPHGGKGISTLCGGFFAGRKPQPGMSTPASQGKRT